jgi:hypothetical protein
MNLFISWSGPVSLEIATALHSWIPCVIQRVKPFISSEDIEKGKSWNPELSGELNRSSHGIVCVTADNVNAPWLYFEAGAISKGNDGSQIWPFLFGVEQQHIEGPFKSFQCTVHEKNDVFAMLTSINNHLGDDKIPDDVLERVFAVWWPQLESTLNGIGQKRHASNHTGYQWLYTIDGLASIHRSCECKEFWWITPRPFANALTAAKAMIEESVGHGVKYSFVIPVSEEAAAETLIQLAHGQPGTIEVTRIPDDQFRKLAATDYLLADPEDLASVQVFLELPIAERGFWIQSEVGSASAFALRFRSLVHDGRNGGDAARAQTVGTGG